MLKNKDITVTFIFAMLLILTILGLSFFSPTEATATPAFIDSTTPTHIFTATSTSIPTFTYKNTPFPTPRLGVVGNNLPDDFSVGPWLDDSIRCDNDPKHNLVEIAGVKISGGTPPYQFTFWQGNRITKINNIYPSNGIIEFIPSIILKKGEYIHIIINFQSATGESEWINDLYYHYLNDPSCKGS